MTDHEIIANIKETLAVEAESISRLAQDMDEEAVLAVAKALVSCKGKIIISGCGTSAMAGRKIMHTLNCVEVPSFFLIPSDAVHGELGALQKDDILILISKGGSTQELVNLIAPCREKGAVLIGVSENPDSTIAKESDIYLKVKVEKEPDKFNMLATASNIAVISMFDSIAIAIMNMTGFTREQFAVIHSGGAVGHRLLNNLK